MLSADSPSHSRQASCARIYTREGHIAAKKLAKVLLFFDMTKYFSKKMQKIFIFHRFVQYS